MFNDEYSNPIECICRDADIDDENLASVLYRLDAVYKKWTGEDGSLGSGHHGIEVAGGAIGAAVGGAIGVAMTAPIRGIVCMVSDLATSSVELCRCIKAEAADAKARKAEKKEGGA